MCELEFNTAGTDYGRWSCRQDGLYLGWYHAPNALDWLWQRINGVKGVVSVRKEGNTLRIISDNSHEYVRLDEVFLFQGSAKEIMQQLRPYMAMMEGS